MKHVRTLALLFLVFLMIFGCQKEGKSVKPITTGELEAHIRFLSDDLLEGRSVGSSGLAVAALYHESLFRSLGLEPLFSGSYRQEFELRGTLPDKKASLEVFSDKSAMEFSFGSQYVVNTPRSDTPEGVEGALVYGGYLIQAPERGWDDIKGAALRNKVLLVEVNEPGNFPGGIFEGEDMTYYGSWTYKFEKASELGATGILIIHNTQGAGYGWGVVRNSWSGESFVFAEKKNMLFFQGWINEETAAEILDAAGYSHEVLAAKAEKDNFQPLPLGLSVRVRQKPSFRTVSTTNIAARLRGQHKKRQDRTVILSAHYDHLGRDPNLEGDQIYNGAVDNCSASGCLLALARFYAQRPKELKVDLVFLAATAEEEGLLGSDYFARQLPLPQSQILANLNLEMTNVWGETEDVYAIGASLSELDAFCRKAAENLGLRYIPERDGNLGYFFRSDQLSFARAGIPAVWLHEGITSRGKEKDYIRKKHEEYRSSKYHKVTDEVEADWDLRGTIQVARWAQEIIRLLGEADELPRFHEMSSFRRDR